MVNRLNPTLTRLAASSLIAISAIGFGALSASAAPTTPAKPVHNAPMQSSLQNGYVQLAQLSAGDRAKGINRSGQRPERAGRGDRTDRRRPDSTGRGDRTERRRPDTSRRPVTTRRDDRTDRRRVERREERRAERQRTERRQERRAERRRVERRHERRADRNRDWRRNYRLTHRSPRNGRGYHNNYRSHLGINFIFGNSGLSNYQWSRTRHDLYRPRYGSFHHYKRRTRCERIIVEANRFGYRVPVSVLECHNPWNGYYIVQGSEQRLHDYHGYW